MPRLKKYQYTTSIFRRMGRIWKMVLLLWYGMDHARQRMRSEPTPPEKPKLSMHLDSPHLPDTRQTHATKLLNSCNGATWQAIVPLSTCQGVSEKTPKHRFQSSNSNS
jgi:hypothetical protein